jgi:hypothetical protein
MLGVVNFEVAGWRLFGRTGWITAISATLHNALLSEGQVCRD